MAAVTVVKHDGLCDSFVWPAYSEIFYSLMGDLTELDKPRLL